jgi:hypothetical protein
MIDMTTGSDATLASAVVIVTLGSFLSAVDLRATTNSTRYTVDREIRFGVPDDRTRAVMRQVPAARDIAAGDFLIAAEDLDDDGTREVLLLARSPSLCVNGRCALIVMQRRPKSIETLLLQRVPSRLALTAEKTDGYRALAAVGANGEIAVGDRRDAALAGKPLVYLVRIDPVARAAQGPTPNSTEPAVAASPAKAGSVRLEDIAAVLALPVGDNNAKIDWKAMEKLPGIRMGKTGDTERYSYRDSTLMLDSLGKADVTWTGISDFVVVAIVNTGKKIPPTQYTSMLQGQFSAARLSSFAGDARARPLGRTPRSMK